MKQLRELEANDKKVQDDLVAMYRMKEITAKEFIKGIEKQDIAFKKEFLSIMRDTKVGK